jgi:hypothetical protein
MSLGGSINDRLLRVYARSSEQTLDRYGQPVVDNEAINATFDGLPCWVDFGFARRVEARGVDGVNTAAVFDCSQWVQDQVIASDIGRPIQTGDYLVFASEPEQVMQVQEVDHDAGPFGGGGSNYRMNLMRSDFRPPEVT